MFEIQNLSFLSDLFSLFQNQNLVASGVTVPTCISYNLGEKLEQETYQMCLAGFGVGLTWASIIMKVGHLAFNRIIEY